MLRTFTRILSLLAVLITAPLGAQILYQENFGTSLNTCTAAAGSFGNWVWTGAGGCAQGNTGAHTIPGAATFSGSSCQFGNGSSTVSGDLITPSVAIGPSGAVLSFKYFLTNECSPSAACTYDQITFLISTNNGVSYTSIAGTAGGVIAGNSTWNTYTMSLNTYSNQAVKLKFNFNSIDGIGNTYDGAYIDDIVITGNCFISLVNAANQSTVAPIICAGQTVALTTDAVSNYTWNTGANTQSVVVSPSVNTVYQVIGTSSANCQTTNTMQVIVNAAVPALTVANTATVGSGTCPNSFVTLTAGGANNYTWTSTPTQALTNGTAFQPTTTATYTVLGSNACGTTSAALSISIHPLPTVNGVASTSSLCSGNPVTLTGTGNATLYVWNGTVANGTAIFPTVTANHTVVGTSALGCTAQAVVPVTVVTTPINPPVPNPPLICIGSTATLSSSGATTYSWITPSGTQAGSLITVSPNTTTTYTLTKSNANCVNTQTVQVIVNNLPVLSVFATPTLVCANNSSTLFAGGAQSYTWNAGGTPAFTLTGSSPIVNPSVTTTYTLSASDGTCANTTTLTVATNPNPTVTIVPTATDICRGDQVSLTANGALGYTWTSPAISSNTNATTILETPQITTLFIVTGTNNFNCSATAQQVVIVRPTPTLQIGTTKPLVCSGAPSSMTVSSAAGANISPCTYVWSSNAANATTSVVIVNPLVTTSYSVVGLAPNGCTNTVNYPISVFLPTFAVNSPTQSCQGGTVVLTATGANTYTWNGNQPFQSIPVSPPGPTVYVVAATSSSNGVNCVSTKSVQVTIYNNPTVTAVATRTLVCKNESTKISGGGASTYTLNTGDTGTLITVFPVGTATNYTITGTDQNGCIGTATIQIKTSTCFGINEQAIADKLGFNVYPNPSNGSFMITTTSDVSVRLENELGQLVAMYDLSADNEHKVKVEGLAAGVYFVTITRGTEHTTGKVIVTR